MCTYAMISIRGTIMIKLNVLEILKEQDHSKYWLYTKMNMSYQNFSRMVNNETTAIHFDNIEKLCNILECTPSDLFRIFDE